LLARGSDPNHCLHGLVYADDLASAKLVRRYGARLDELGHGETPLIYAVRHRRARMAEWLLREGADARLRDTRGFSALHHAVRRRLPTSTLRLLVRCGADVRAAADRGVTVGSLATRAQRRLLGLGVSG
jgi:ankyrin repeat protein